MFFDNGDQLFAVKLFILIVFIYQWPIIYWGFGLRWFLVWFAGDGYVKPFSFCQCRAAALVCWSQGPGSDSGFAIWWWSSYRKVYWREPDNCKRLSTCSSLKFCWGYRYCWHWEIHPCWNMEQLWQHIWYVFLFFFKRKKFSSNLVWVIFLQHTMWWLKRLSMCNFITSFLMNHVTCFNNTHG